MTIIIKDNPDKATLKNLKAGDEVLFTGTIYTARDMAHARMVEAFKKGKNIPIKLKGAIIYYCGPTPSAKKGKVGAAGPTTSSRMDKFTPDILDKGVLAVIGKGQRAGYVRDSFKKNGAVYFLAIAGAGALLSGRIKSARPVGYKELGAEAVYEMKVEGFPLIVGIDSRGKDIYERLKDRRGK
jgi:fumarate hydratase subunit beta